MSYNLTHHNERKSFIIIKIRITREQVSSNNKFGKCARAGCYNVNRIFQQEEIQLGMHAHIVYMKSIELKLKLLFNIIDCNFNLMFFKKHKIHLSNNVDEVVETEIEEEVESPITMYINLDNTR
jgi:hypothetical protein